MMEKITAPLPYEWFPFLCQFRCTQLISKNDYSHLKREWREFEVMRLRHESRAQYTQLCDGNLKDRLGISGEESDLRLAEFLARAGLKPTLVFYGITAQHRMFRDCHRHFAAPPTDRYIDSLVHRVFGALFEVALGSEVFRTIDSKRINDLYRLVDEEDDAYRLVDESDDE